MCLLNSRIKLPNALLVGAGNALFSFLRNVSPHPWPVITLLYNVQALVSASEIGKKSKEVSDYLGVGEMF